MNLTSWDEIRTFSIEWSGCFIRIQRCTHNDHYCQLFGECKLYCNKLGEGSLLANNYQAATELQKSGWSIYPLSPGTKIPIKGSSGWNDATNDLIRLMNGGRKMQLEILG